MLRKHIGTQKEISLVLILIQFRPSGQNPNIAKCQRDCVRTMNLLGNALPVCMANLKYIPLKYIIEQIGSIGANLLFWMKCYS